MNRRQFFTTVLGVSGAALLARFIPTPKQECYIEVRKDGEVLARFPAFGDGVRDDTANFQEAINYVAEMKDVAVIYFPSNKTFLVKSAI